MCLESLGSFFPSWSSSVVQLQAWVLLCGFCWCLWQMRINSCFTETTSLLSELNPSRQKTCRSHSSACEGLVPAPVQHHLVPCTYWAAYALQSMGTPYRSQLPQLRFISFCFHCKRSGNPPQVLIHVLVETSLLPILLASVTDLLVSGYAEEPGKLILPSKLRRHVFTTVINATDCVLEDKWWTRRNAHGLAWRSFNQRWNLWFRTMLAK